MNDIMQYWREKWNKAADHSKATDRSRLFKKPEQKKSNENNTPFLELNMSSHGQILRSKKAPNDDSEAAMIFKISANKYDQYKNETILFKDKFFITDLADYNINNRYTANIIRHESRRNLNGNQNLDWKRIIIGRTREEEFKGKNIHKEFLGHSWTPTFGDGAIEVDKGNAWVKIHYVQNLSNTGGCWGIADSIEFYDGRLYFNKTGKNIGDIIDSFLELYDIDKKAFIKLNTYKRSDRTYSTITNIP